MKMLKNLHEVQEYKIRYEMGQLYKYLNSIESEIKISITANDLKTTYSLHTHSRIKNRIVCPFHSGAKNPSSFCFNDNDKTFHCQSCKEKGTYIKFISKIENVSLNEAKLIVATKFTNINLSFHTLDEYKDLIREQVSKRYEEIKSLDLKDYYDISILPSFNPKPDSTYTSATTNNTDIYTFNNSNKTPHKDTITIPTTYKLPSLNVDEVVRTADAEEVKRTGMTSYSKAVITAFQSNLIKDFANHDLNSLEKLKEFMRRKYNINTTIAEKYGLIYFDKSNQSKLSKSDFFMLNNRAFFPFKDHETGRIVGFQCRNTNLTAKKQFKYLNISDYGEMTTNKDGKTYRGIIPFAIGNFLFNLHDLKGNNIDNVWITEGVADAIKLLEIGYNAISPGQSNLTDRHIQLLSRYFSSSIKINLFFDSDDNGVGQNNSIRIAYKLWQCGFRNINIVRTYQELGKDLTDCSVKLQNDDLLKTLIDTWQKESYKFKPASNEDLNSLIKTKLYSESDALSIDPRNIQNRLDFANSITESIDISKLPVKEINKIQGLKNVPVEFLTFLIENLKSDISSETTEIKEEDKPEIIESDAKSEEKEDWDIFQNTSSKQLHVLKEKFAYDILIKIETECSKKQINAIIGNIKRNKDFDISDYVKSLRVKPVATNIHDKSDTDSIKHDGTSYDAIDYNDFDIPF